MRVLSWITIGEVGCCVIWVSAAGWADDVVQLGRRVDLSKNAALLPALVNALGNPSEDIASAASHCLGVFLNCSRICALLTRGFRCP